MKNKLGLLMIVAILAMAFSCGKKTSGETETASTTDTTKVVADTTAKAPADTTKAK